MPFLRIAFAGFFFAGTALAQGPMPTPTPVWESLRDVTIFAWLAAPALFARSGAPIPGGEGLRRPR